VAGVITHQKIQFNFLKTKIQKHHLMNRRIKIATATLVLILIATFNAVAQPYGQSEYINANFNYILSKGLYYQAATPGFIMAGYRPTTIPNSPNYVVYRTSPGGGLTGATAWTHGFWITDCQSNQVITCDGVDIIEANGSGYDFLIAMANKDGLFINGIIATGMPGSIQLVYSFPAGATNATKPHIVQLASTDYIVCGSYQSAGTSYMYLVKFDVNGAPINNMLFFPSAGNTMVPNDIIESPYNYYATDELAIVGTYNDGTRNKGFLLITEHVAYGVSQFSEFSNTATSDEKFGSIIAVGGSTGSYLIHGVTNHNTGFGNPYRPTCMNVQADGLTTNWSNYYSSFNMSSFANPVQIVERPNTYSTQDYFMGFTGNVGMMQKIDATGAPFSIGTNTNNYNYYQAGNGMFTDCQSISYNNNAGNDEGMHFYGNNSNNNFFLVQAYFNLQTNPNAMGSPCDGLYESSTFTQSANQTGNLATGPAISSSGSLSDCGGSGFFFSTQPVTHNQLCGGDLSDIAGNNLRKTDLGENQQDAITIHHDFANMELIVEGTNNFQYSLMQIDGKLVASGCSSGSIPTQNLTSGIYLIRIINQSSMLTQKVIISH